MGSMKFAKSLLALALAAAAPFAQAQAAAGYPNRPIGLTLPTH